MRSIQKRNRRRGPKFRDWNSVLPDNVTHTVVKWISSLGSCTEAGGYLQSEFLAKFCDESVVPRKVRRSNAIALFHETENLNAKTNRWLQDVDPGFNILPRVSFSRFVRHCRVLVRNILGPLSDEIVLGTFTGGASTSRLRTESHPAFKFTGVAHTTEGACQYIDNIRYMAPLLRQYDTFLRIAEVPGGILFTVPKKTDIDRCACKEPDINMFLQKGVGDHIRRRLRRFGINLNDQSRNRSLAYEGSKSGHLATLDLSAASDSMTCSLVELLLPRDWYLYLNDIRSQNIVIDGETYRTELFSTMGNGFTFELESMIFFVLMRTVAYFEGVPGVISVYGDDIIIPVGMYDLSVFVLAKFGFRVNQKKSFSTGPFRESCGGHYHNGEDITPFYLKRKLRRMTDIIRLTNQLRKWALTRDPFRQYEYPLCWEVWRRMSLLVPRDLWGGADLDVDTQLVTPPQATSFRLVRVKVPAKLPPVGRYVLWHSTYWNRSQATESPEKPTSTNQKCRKRPARSGAPVTQFYFHEELV